MLCPKKNDEKVHPPPGGDQASRRLHTNGKDQQLTNVMPKKTEEGESAGSVLSPMGGRERCVSKEAVRNEDRVVNRGRKV